MGQYTIIVCKGCGKMFRIYYYEVYLGDSRYCRGCNRKSGENEPTDIIVRIHQEFADCHQ